ncbi:TlpA disulfide reductase family protein [uncultured Erythrobacter sp.]|uniref:TlpA family protein disulfide reductase n=1 Tax=uncultured Erythrobacter sp. TaxID=263913 RepID=UPI0026323C87|nr:TlpA disulfide reductase family protein [uncultured Erythrobacter sp.]
MLRVCAFVSLAALTLAACDSGQGSGAQETTARDGASEAPQPPQLPGQIVRAFAGTELPALTFEDPEGNVLDLAALDQPVLVNLWATWCVPCRVEMPALETLAGEMEGDLRVLTVSQDIRGAEVVIPFFEREGFERLEMWLDPTNALGQELSEGGLLPMTILFDAEGREIFRVAGEYAWDSEDAIAQVREAIAADAQ